ncbi:MAG: hypothetical protein ABI460_01295 [Caldimonas sp.]
MQLHVRHLSPLALAFAALLCCGAAGAVPAAGASAPSGPMQVYQQRGADGRIVLTDRPSPTAVTERSWQLEREDPQDAQRRALEVRREADAVSERVQRRIDAQQRSVENDLERMRLAQRDREFLLARADSDDDGGSVIVVPAPNRRFAGHRFPPGHRPPMRKPPARSSQFSRSTLLESR